MAIASERSSRRSLGSRRSAIAAAASVVAAMALAVAVAGRTCSVDDSSPQAAVRDFAAAANAGDREALYDLFSPETQHRLEEAAKRATDLVGGARRYEALDMISISRSSDVPQPKDFVLVEESASSALVEIISRSGERSRVRVVKVDGRWRIDLSAYSAQ